MTKDFAFLKPSNEFLRFVDDTLVPGVPDTKKIVFLDIDGVIDGPDRDERLRHDLKATASYLALKYHNDIFLRMRDFDIGAAYYNWDDVAVGRLKKLLYETGSEVVIISDYCIKTSLEELKALFLIHGMDDYVVGKIDDTLGSKLEGTKRYLEEYKSIIKTFVLFDNDNEAGLDAFGEHFILTKDLLTEKNIEDAEKILGKVL